MRVVITIRYIKVAKNRREVESLHKVGLESLCLMGTHYIVKSEDEYRYIQKIGMYIYEKGYRMVDPSKGIDTTNKLLRREWLDKGERKC